MAPDEVRTVFILNPKSGASVSCGYFGDTAAVSVYLEKWKAVFRPSTARRGCADVHLYTRSGRRSLVANALGRRWRIHRRFDRWRSSECAPQLLSDAPPLDGRWVVSH